MPEWEKLTQPQSAAFVSMPSLIDPALAPEGCHVIHAYLPATEPYEVWEGVARGTPAYDALKAERDGLVTVSVELPGQSLGSDVVQQGTFIGIASSMTIRGRRRHIDAAVAHVSVPS